MSICNDAISEMCGGHFEKMIYFSGQQRIFLKYHLVNLYTKFHACITICTIMSIISPTKCKSDCWMRQKFKGPGQSGLAIRCIAIVSLRSFCSLIRLYCKCCIFSRREQNCQNKLHHIKSAHAKVLIKVLNSPKQ